MAVQLGINICQTSNCKVIKFSETTGVYDAVNNPGGWGAPNPATTNVTGISLTIVDPSGTTTIFNNANAPALVANFPDDTGLVELPIYNGVAGLTLSGPSASSFTDGFYTFTYFVTGVFGPGPIDFDYTVTQNFLLTCQTRCCVDKLFHMASQTKECANCDSDLLNKALEAEAYLKSAEYAAACGKIEMAKQHLAKAQWICNTKNCSGC